MLKLVSKMTENKDFNQNLETRVVCDASTFSVGAELEQLTKKGWVAIAYASRLLVSLKEKY